MYNIYSNASSYKLDFIHPKYVMACFLVILRNPSNKLLLKKHY
jgi:hypothetical protein